MPSENKSTANSQNFLIISLITVFLIISLFVLLFVYQKDDSTDSESQSSTTQTVDSSDWKTYTSTGYNYSIDYPADWTKAELSTTTDGTIPEIILLNLTTQNDSTNSKPNIVLIAGQKEYCNSSEGPDCTEIETLQVNGDSVVKYKDNENDKIYYKVNDNIWLLTTANGNQALIDQVVKTIKVN